MDQKAFRSLLSEAGGAGSASQQTSDAKQAPPSHMRAFGLAPKRRAATAATGSNTELFQPRKIQKTGHAEEDIEGKAQAPRPKGPRRNANTGEVYRDRAAARRKGKGDEFEDAEKVLEDFNAQNEDIDKEKIHEQMKHLGGDEKHTVLVKGLDFALLAANKAKLRQPEEETKEGDERPAKGDPDNEDLDRAFESAATKGESVPQEPHAEVKVKSKFRPIGAPSSAGTAEEVDLGPIGPDGKPEYKIVNGKRMRRKKKVVQDERTSVQGSAAEAPKKESPEVQAKASVSAVEAPKKAVSVQESTEQRPSAPESLTRKKIVEEAQQEVTPSSAKRASSSPPRAVSEQAQESTTTDISLIDAVDEDEDIFAGVGDWKGIPDEDEGSEEEGEAREEVNDKQQEPASSSSSARDTAAASTSAAQPAGKRDWFSATGAVQEEQEKEIEGATKLPGSLEGVLQRAKEGPSRQQEDADDEAAGSDEEEERGGAGRQEQPLRLQGFANSALPSEFGREMLAREKEREDKIKEKRKQKRAAKKAAAAEGLDGGEK